VRALRSFFCAHDYMRMFAPHRVYLRCEKCGMETTGLRDDYTDLPRPRPTDAADVRRTFHRVKSHRKAIG